MRLRAVHQAIFFAGCLLIASWEQHAEVHFREPALSAGEKSQLAITSVQIIEQDFSLSSSPKTLEEWKDSNGPKVSNLPIFEVLVNLRNVSNSSLQEADFIALTTIDFVIAPTYLYQGDVKKIMQHGNWGRLISVDDVKMETVPFVKPGERVTLRFKAFNLTNLLAKYKGQDDTLWPWALRVNVHVMNRELRRVASGQATLRIIPAENRIRVK